MLPLESGKEEKSVPVKHQELTWKKHSLCWLCCSHSQCLALAAELKDLLSICICDTEELGSIDHPGGVLWGVRTLNVELSPSLTQHPSISLLFFQHLLCLAACGLGLAVLLGAAPALQGGPHPSGTAGFHSKMRQC